MREMLSDINNDYIDRSRKVAVEVLKPWAAKWDIDQSYPWEAIDALKEANLMGVWIPEEYGGKGHGVLNLCLIVEELSRFCGGVGVTYAVNALGSFPILLGGTEEQKNKWLPKVASGENLISFGLSEKEAGSDAGGLSMQAVKQDGVYILNGDKKWNTNGGEADVFTIFCVTDPKRGGRGVSAIVAEKGLEGFRTKHTEDKMGIRCSSVVELEFKDTVVPENYLLGGKEGLGFKHAMMTLDRARPGVAAQAVGLAQGAFDLALEFVRANKYGKQDMSSEQSIQFELAEMATKIEAARALVHMSATAIDNKVKNVSKVSAMGKVFATDVAMEVTTKAVDIFGKIGGSQLEPVEKFMRDAKITQIYEGTNQIQRMVIARALLREAAAQNG